MYTLKACKIIKEMFAGINDKKIIKNNREQNKK